MELKDIRELSANDLKSKINEVREELANLRFQHSLKQLDNTGRVRLVRRELARLLTIQNEDLKGIRAKREEKTKARQRS